MGTSPLFSGNSRYANDFSQIIDRTVSIASLPIIQLGQERATLSDRASELGGINTKVAALRTAISALQNASGLDSYAVSVSDGAVATPSVTEGALPGAYTFEIVSMGSKTITSSLESLPGVENPATQSISASSSFTLTVGSQTYSISPTSNTLDALVTKINEAAPDSVQAVLVNVGSVAAPDYRLSVQSKKLGPQTIQLNDGSNDLLSTTTSGTLASYRVNGLPATPVESDTETQVSIAPGLKLDFKKVGSTTITINRNTGALTSAFAQFATAYNGVINALDEHRGEGSGVLRGEAVLADVASSLQRLSRYSTSTGAIKSFTDAGFSFSDRGVLTYDASKATSGSLSDALAFLGSTEGGGFLGEAEDLVENLTTTGTGLIPATIESFNRQIATTDQLINSNQERIDLMRENLMTRLATADAMIAMLEQQANYMASLIDATRMNIEQMG